MQPKPLMYLAAAVACVALILTLTGRGGLDARTRTLLEVESTSYPRAEDQFTAQREAIAGSLTDAPALFRRKSRQWELSLETAAARLDEGKTSLRGAAELARENRGELRPKIETALLGAREARIFALAESATIEGEIERLLELREDREKTVSDARADFEAIQAMSLSETESRVDRAKRDWPPKEADLGRRLSGLLATKESAGEAWNTVRAEDAKASDDIDLIALASASDLLRRGLIDLSEANAHLAALVSQLYISWDKILVDMSIEEGEEVTFQHKYRTVRVTAGEGEAPNPPSEKWEAVSRADYERHKENLGMTVASKPAGLYDSEIDAAAAQPAGFAYIATPEEGRNEYGQWRRDDRGNSFWEFYGKYAFMRSLFWGPMYSPIHMGDYRGYRRSYDAGRSYYGTSRSGVKQYGSSAQKTRTRLASSRYVGNDGFKGSRYEQSGGKYKGSKYETKASRSRGGTRAASTSRSRSTRSRSSSRSRGGK